MPIALPMIRVRCALQINNLEMDSYKAVGSFVFSFVMRNLLSAIRYSTAGAIASQDDSQNR